MKIFLDSSVLIAASGSCQGASFAIINLAAKNHWQLLSSAYCLAEVERNIGKLSLEASKAWKKTVQPSLKIVGDVLSISKPLLIEASKDKPPLLSAIAVDAKVFLTLDRKDFGPILNTSVYDVDILTPENFLEKQRRVKPLTQ